MPLKKRGRMQAGVWRRGEGKMNDSTGYLDNKGRSCHVRMCKCMESCSDTRLADPCRNQISQNNRKNLIHECKM